MIKTHSFTSIYFIDVDDNIDKIIAYNFRISSNLNRINSILQTGNVKNIIGFNEAQSLESSKCVFYNNFDYDIAVEKFNDRNCLISTLLLSEFFYHALWLIKDNSVQCELAHLLFFTEKSYSIHSNFWSSSYSNSIGNTESTYFSSSDLDNAIRLFPIILQTNKQDTPTENSAIKVTSKTSRLSRAFFFIQSARSTHDIGTKISLYCSVLESIFSISTSELKHRLSEAVSFFLENTSVSRKITYKSLQNAYDIRSSVVHGDGIQSKFLKNDAQLLLNTAKETDEILRRCIRKIIESSELYELFTVKNKGEVGEYLQNLIFE